MFIAGRARIQILATAALCLFAAPPAECAPRFLVRSWESEDGLPSNVVRTVVQAVDGYLWVGTAEGVVRFDGQRFTGFADPALARQPVRALFPLGNGEVWVTTTNNTVMRGRGTELREVTLPGDHTRSIGQIVLSGKDDVFIVRGGDEVFQVDGNHARPVAERTPAVDELLKQDAAAEPERGRTFQADAAIRLRGARGELWAFKAGAGLTLTDSAGHTDLVSLPSELPSTVQSMLEDREGNLWLAMRTQGLWRLRPSRVEMLTKANGLASQATLLVREDHAGNLWIAPLGGGLDCATAGAVKHVEVGTGRTISALLETRAGDLIAATGVSRLYLWKDGVFSAAFPRDRGPTKVIAMTEDANGQVWYGGRFGLSSWEGGEVRHQIDLGSSQIITALASAGTTVWAGSAKGYVFRGHNDRFEPVGSADSFEHQQISSLLPDADGSVWVGTLGGGLFHVKGDRVFPLASRMEDADPRITCVLDDGAGYLWLGTLGGICRAEKAKLLSASPVTSGATLVLDRSDGLLTRECTSGGQPAGWRGRDGTLYFSTGNGVASVRPERLSLNTIVPPVVIEEASADGRPPAPGSWQLQAGPGRSRLEFRYTALTFSAPEKVRFRTRLEGLDEIWRDAGNQRTTAYEAVPPGHYRFRVIAQNGDGIWNEAGAAISVEVRPHIWETRWFQVGVAILAAGMAVGVGALIMRARFRGRLLRLEALTSREKERARIAQDLHDDLGASLTEISLLANLAAEERQAGDLGDEALPEVATKAQALVGALDEIVWAVNPRHDTLRSLAEYIAAFGGKFLAHAGMTLRRDLPRELPEISLDAERRHSVFLAVREALNNVVKHSAATEVWLRLRLEDRQLEIVVEDNGRGFDSAAASDGDGVGNLASRLERVGGRCSIESSPGGGTKVLLSLPLS